MTISRGDICNLEDAFYDMMQEVRIAAIIMAAIESDPISEKAAKQLAGCEEKLAVKYKLLVRQAYAAYSAVGLFLAKTEKKDAIVKS